MSTVLSIKAGKETSLSFWQKVSEDVIKKIYIDYNLQQRSFSIFQNIKSKNVSFVDASNLAVIFKYKIDFLLTFDKSLTKIAQNHKIKIFI
jgi:predicted nucleic acid-binding protein